jgi:hypothetical protein
MRYRVKFKHTLEEHYSAIVECNSEDEAIEIVEDSPFDYLENEDPDDSQGLRIDIIDVEDITDDPDPEITIESFSNFKINKLK